MNAHAPSARTTWRRLVLLCALLLPAPALAVARDDGTPAQQVGALFAQYESLLKYRDFSSFSRRMEAIREIGRLRAPASADLLVRIVRESKSVDDRVVALIALGPLLDPETALRVGELVARDETEVLGEALGACYEQAAEPATLAWLAQGALESKHACVMRAALAAQWIHGEPTARDRILELYAEYAPKREGMAVAHAAVRALGSINGPAVRPFLLRATGHADWRIRLAAADVMARQQPMDLNVRGALRQLLVDPENVVRQTAAANIGEAKLIELAPELIEHLSLRNVRTRTVAHDALTRISGRDLGFDPDAWQKWWKHRGPVPPGEQPTASTSVATYYGMGVWSDRLLFIVDVSGSMAFPWGRDQTRIEVARSELTRVLKSLSPSTLFNLIVFSDDVRVWRKGEVRAEKETVERALQWVAKVFEAPEGGTFMHAALERAFKENPEIDTIFLLTDGLATDGEPIVPEAILASVNVWNRYRRVVIHTIALTLEELDPKGLPKRNLDEIKRFMRQVAKLTGGESKIITKPP